METQVELNYLDGIISVAVLDKFNPETETYEREEVTFFPVNLLDQLLEEKYLKLYIIEALAFREIIRNASEYEWTTIKALINRDLSSYKVYLVEPETYQPYSLISDARLIRILKDGRLAIVDAGGWLTHLHSSSERILLITPALNAEEYMFS